MGGLPGQLVISHIVTRHISRLLRLQQGELYVAEVLAQPALEAGLAGEGDGACWFAYGDGAGDLVVAALGGVLLEQVPGAGGQGDGADVFAVCGHGALSLRGGFSPRVWEDAGVTSNVGV